MGTNCMIGIRTKSKKVKFIYCHNDGDPGTALPLLAQFYNTEEKVNDLINLGCISSLGSKLNPTTDQHSFNHPERDVVVAYYRDRHEPWEHCKPVVETITDYKNCSDYCYLFDPDKNCWLVLCEGTFLKPIFIRE